MPIIFFKNIIVESHSLRNNSLETQENLICGTLINLFQSIFKTAPFHSCQKDLLNDEALILAESWNQVEG